MTNTGELGLPVTGEMRPYISVVINRVYRVDRIVRVAELLDGTYVVSSFDQMCREAVTQRMSNEKKKRVECLPLSSGRHSMTYRELGQKQSDRCFGYDHLAAHVEEIKISPNPLQIGLLSAQAYPTYPHYSFRLSDHFLPLHRLPKSRVDCRVDSNAGIIFRRARRGRVVNVSRYWRHFDCSARSARGLPVRCFLRSGYRTRPNRLPRDLPREVSVKPDDASSLIYLPLLVIPRKPRKIPPQCNR